MTKPRNTYWIDLTDLSQWGDNHTGIQRVIFNVSKYYAKDANVHFFIFDSPRTGFFEVSFNVVDRPLGVVAAATNNDVEKLSLIKDIVQSIPSRYIRLLPKSIRIGLKSIYRKAIIFKENKKKQVPKEKLYSLDKNIVFSKNDTVLVLGSPWANPDMLPYLISAKKTTGFKLIILIYDLIPILMPHLFGEQLLEEFTHCLFDTVTNADGLVAISESTKRDVQKFMNDLLVPEIPVGTVRLGDEFERPNFIKPNIYIKSNHFILSVGTFEIRKNYQLLYFTYKEAKRRGILLPKLVIAGRPGWLTKDLEYVIRNDSEINDDIIILHGASDSNLAWLYKNCRFTVYPSVYEGWGLPIAESLGYGKVCIASNTSSMIEIAPSLVDHFSPYDTVGLLSLIVKYSSDKTLEEREKRIKLEYGNYTWEDTYDQLQQFIEDLNKSNFINN